MYGLVHGGEALCPTEPQFRHKISKATINYFFNYYFYFSAEDSSEKKTKTYRFPMIAGTWAGGGEIQLPGDAYLFII